MAKSELTLLLEKMLYQLAKRQANVFACHEVTLGWSGSEIVDFITYSFKREVRCYEIKTTKADFNSKAKVSFFGNYNYYVMPIELYNQVSTLIEDDIGVYIYKTRTGRLSNVKKAKRRELRADKEAILSSMLRSMQRELNKLKSF